MAEFANDKVASRLDAGLAVYLVAGLCAGLGQGQGALNGSVVRFDNFSIASNKGLQRYAFWCRESQINSDTVFGSFSVAHAQDSLTVTDVPGQQFTKPLVVNLAGQAQLGRTIPLPC